MWSACIRRCRSRRRGPPARPTPERRHSYRRPGSSRRGPRSRRRSRCSGQRPPRRRVPRGSCRLGTASQACSCSGRRERLSSPGRRASAMTSICRRRCACSRRSALQAALGSPASCPRRRSRMAGSPGHRLRADRSWPCRYTRASRSRPRRRGCSALAPLLAGRACSRPRRGSDRSRARIAPTSRSRPGADSDDR